MAFKITDYNGNTSSATGDYPFGDVLNDPGGTLVDKTMLDDLLQASQKLMSMAGIAPNSAPDNNGNGYQLVQAMINAMSANAGEVVKYLIGSSYSTNTAYLLTGSATSSADGYILYNDKVYFLKGNTTGSCGFGTVDVITADTTTAGVNKMVGGFLSAKVVCAASGTGTMGDYTALVRNWIPFANNWINLSGQTGGNWAAGAVQPRYKKDQFGVVKMQGQFITLSGSLSSIIDTLPAGFRPSEDVRFPVAAWNASTSNFYTAYIKVFSSTGIINYEQIGSGPSAANWYVDISSIRFETT